MHFSSQQVTIHYIGYPDSIHERRRCVSRTAEKNISRERTCNFCAGRRQTGTAGSLLLRYRDETISHSIWLAARRPIVLL